MRVRTTGAAPTMVLAAALPAAHAQNTNWPEEFARVISNEIARWKKVVKVGNIRVQ